jgi:putative hydrolase of the HAD superfamily
VITTAAGRTLTTCVFDLDDTVYPRACGLMPAVGDRIRRYLLDRLRIDAADVERVRRDYFERYGTALRGLQLENVAGLDAEDYLAYVHDLDIAQFVQPAPDFEAMLAALPLAKVIFTNATREHAERVLGRLGVRRHFDRIVDLRDLEYACKPDPQAYARLLELIGQPAAACLYVDDAARNLRPAGELGMLTVLIDPQPVDGAGLDFVIPSIVELGRVVAQLQHGLPPDHAAGQETADAH